MAYHQNSFDGFTTPNTNPSSNRFSQSRGYPSQQQQNSANSDLSTLRLVEQLKKVVQQKVQRGFKLAQPVVELDIVKIKEQLEPNQYDIDQWKENLPQPMKRCSDSVLRVSMAYGNNPQKIISVLQAKMNQSQTKYPMESNYSIDNIVEPLKMLKKDLDDNPMRNIFFAVRNINDRNTDRVARLFLSEAHHFTPALRDYDFENAHRAVLGILDTTYESNRPQDLLTIVKTMDETDLVKDYLNKLSKESTVRTPSSHICSSGTSNVGHQNQPRLSHHYGSMSDINLNSTPDSGHLPPSQPSARPFVSQVFFPTPVVDNQAKNYSPKLREKLGESRDQTSPRSPMIASASPNQFSPSSERQNENIGSLSNDPAQILAQFTSSRTRSSSGTRRRPIDYYARDEQAKK